jgi:hypothetical protein
MELLINKKRVLRQGIWKVPVVEEGFDCQLYTLNIIFGPILNHENFQLIQSIVNSKGQLLLLT